MNNYYFVEAYVEKIKRSLTQFRFHHDFEAVSVKSGYLKVLIMMCLFFSNLQCWVFYEVFLLQS